MRAVQKRDRLKEQHNKGAT